MSVEQPNFTEGILSQIPVTRVISSRYAARNSNPSSSKLEIEAALSEYSRNIPPILQYESVEPHSRQGFWAANLSLAYECVPLLVLFAKLFSLCAAEVPHVLTPHRSYTTVLLCRPPRSILGEEGTKTWGNGARAVKSANKISRVMEDLLLASMDRYCQIYA